MPTDRQPVRNRQKQSEFIYFLINIQNERHLKENDKWLKEFIVLEAVLQREVQG